MSVTSNNLLIGLSGKAGSGKNTVADMLYGFRQLAFASTLKQACKLVFGWDERHVNGDLKDYVCPVFDITPRHAMQTLGTEWGRGCIGKDLWLMAIENQIKSIRALDSTANIVITDIRFENEAELVTRLGGYVINIERPNNGLVPLGNHSSEVGLNYPKALSVVNDGAKEQLSAALTTAIAAILDTRERDLLTDPV